MAESVPHDTSASHDDHHDHHEQSIWEKYFFSTDHKIIGIQFLFTCLFFLLIGGLLAVLLRYQLGFPGRPLPGGDRDWEATDIEELLDYVDQAIPTTETARLDRLAQRCELLTRPARLTTNERGSRPITCAATLF